MDELYVLEWSREQNCLHIQPATRTAEMNLRAFVLDQPTTDYQVLVVGTRSECDQVARRLQQVIVSRDRQKQRLSVAQE